MILTSILKKWITTPRPNLLSKFFAEFSACAIFHFIGSAAPTPWANGIILAVLVYYTAKTSGAHLNPALSLTFMLLGHTNPIEMIIYWIAQMMGCICGAIWLAILVPGLYFGIDGGMGCFYPPTQSIIMTKAYVFGWEALGTFCFILPIFSVVWYTLHKKGYGNTGPLMVGLSLVATALAVAPYTGAAFNPARVLASPAVFKCNNEFLFYYVAGELLGASLVPFIIAPWYGIAPNSWYISMVPEKAKNFFDTVSNKKLRGLSILNEVLTNELRELHTPDADKSEKNSSNAPMNIVIPQRRSIQLEIDFEN